MGSFGLVSIIYGSFTAPGAREALAGFSGCEPHAEGFGGSILLSKHSGSWKLVNYIPALITSHCRTYPMKSGRDLLLCEGEDHHMDASWQGVSVTRFSGIGTARSRNVFTAIDTRNACGPSATWGSLDRIALRDLNGDGMPDLTMSVSVGQGTFPKQGGSCIEAPVHPTERKYVLHFLFQRRTSSFLPAPSSTAQVESLRSIFNEAFRTAQRQVLSGP